MKKKQLYQPNWSWSKDFDLMISKWCIGRTLNFPCGMSNIGDVRADLDKTVKPDVIADLYKSKEYFKKREFDTVLCDPPYSFYSKRKWIAQLSDIAAKRLIFSTPTINIILPKRIWKKTYYIIENNSPWFIRVIQVFDRLNKEL